MVSLAVKPDKPMVRYWVEVLMTSVATLTKVVAVPMLPPLGGISAKGAR